MLNGVEDDRRRVRAVRASDDPCTGALGPGLELLSSSRPKRVTSRQDNPPACLHLPQGKLPNRCGLANPVHADEEPHGRPVAVREDKRADIALEHRDEIILKRLEESGGVGGGKGTAAQLCPKIS